MEEKAISRTERKKRPAGYKVSNVDEIVLLELAINSVDDDKKRRGGKGVKLRRTWRKGGGGRLPPLNSSTRERVFNPRSETF